MLIVRVFQKTKSDSFETQTTTTYRPQANGGSGCRNAGIQRPGKRIKFLAIRRFTVADKRYDVTTAAFRDLNMTKTKVSQLNAGVAI
jgi:hypothetical protein